MKHEYDPKCEDFDPYECWDKTNCDYCKTYYDEDANEEWHCCEAPFEFVCPLFKIKVEEDLEM